MNNNVAQENECSSSKRRRVQAQGISHEPLFLKGIACSLYVYIYQQKNYNNLRKVSEQQNIKLSLT